MTPHDPETEQWSRVEQLLASVRDELHYLRHAFMQSKSTRTLRWKPEPLPRPGVAPRRRRGPATDAQLNALEAHLARTQGPPPS